MMWVRGSTRDPPPSDRRTWPRSARDGGQHRVDGSVGKGHVCVFAGECGKCFGLKKECARKGTKVDVLAVDRAGADTKANTSGAAAHLRLVIFVWWITAASAVAPSAPILLFSRL